MTQSKIQHRHLERMAFVYLRQSGPGQVRKNRESQKRQREMVTRVMTLGWPEHRVRLLDGDSGNSGATQTGRQDYQTMLEAVVLKKAGLICASELSRLVRDHQDWNQMIRLCRFQDVLLADEHRIYDPADPHDRVVLGIQGAFNEFELTMICDRMQASRAQKAQRGELYEAFPAGYICRRGVLYEKHPEPRVQRAIEHLFVRFEHAPSVHRLFCELLEEGFQLPVVPHGKDWREVEWVRPSYQRLLQLLRNPTYAGIYVRGRNKTETFLNKEGHADKRRRRVTPDQWEVFIEDHHEPYITMDQWKRNCEKISSNAVMKSSSQRAPQNGKGLMAGLLRCRRCGHKLHAIHRRGNAAYVCRGGASQRDAGGRACYSFQALRLDKRLEEQILDVVSPAALAATQRAAEQLAADHQQQRRVFLDRLEACREAEERAAMEYKKTHVTYRAVRAKLAEEWEQAIADVKEQEARLTDFDDRQMQIIHNEQRQQLEQVADDLPRVWRHP